MSLAQRWGSRPVFAQSWKLVAFSKFGCARRGVSLTRRVRVKDTNVGEKIRRGGGGLIAIGLDLPAEDGCNTCQCTAAGSWACTLKACDVACDLGDQKLADDGCNTCTCAADGSWACTEKACGPEPECTPGSTRQADDGCNSCGCTSDGFWACTLIYCDPDPVCELGTERPADDGCNTCSCVGDGWACTGRACVPEPTTCKPGEQRAAEDGCNTHLHDSGDGCTERVVNRRDASPRTRAFGGRLNTCTIESASGPAPKGLPILCTLATPRSRMQTADCDEQGSGVHEDRATSVRPDHERAPADVAAAVPHLCGGPSGLAASTAAVHRARVGSNRRKLVRALPVARRLPLASRPKRARRSWCGRGIRSAAAVASIPTPARHPRAGRSSTRPTSAKARSSRSHRTRRQPSLVWFLPIALS